jgi:16S rRNA (cytosine967-C5)-methyltransferase
MRIRRNLIRRVSPARLAAFDVLEEVETGAYASDALRERSRDLTTRDAGLAAQIVFGSLRYQGQLDFLIFHYSGRTAEQLDGVVRWALRAAILQMRYLERVPAHAAVHESVELVKFRKRAAAGFVNAVLRKVDRTPARWPDLPVELSCPAWLLEHWSRHFGEALAQRIARAALQEPVPYIRVPAGSSPSGQLETEPTMVPGAFRVRSPLPPGIRLHDISSQAIVPLLELRPGDSYLDLCAAPGNKTLQALETPLGLAVACDISPSRIRDIPAQCPRAILDATQPLPFGNKFDRIFIDAPCSGTGTLARNPEIKWRVKPEDLARFGDKQQTILSQALPALAPGGRLVYATCSLEQEENEEVIKRVIGENPTVGCVSTIWRIPGRDEGDGFFAAVLEAKQSG